MAEAENERAWKRNHATELLTRYAASNDERYAKDIYARTSLERYRQLDLEGVARAERELIEQRHKAQLATLSRTSSHSLLGYVAILAYLLAFVGLVGGFASKDPMGFVVGGIAAAYALWHHSYEKKLVEQRNCRAKELEVLKWVRIEKGDRVATMMQGLPAVPEGWL